MVETYSHVCVKILRGSVLWTRDCSISKLCNWTTIKITAGNIFRTLLHLFVDKLLLRHKVGDKFSPFRIPYIITLQEFIFLLPWDREWTRHFQIDYSSWEFFFETPFLSETEFRCHLSFFWRLFFDMWNGSTGPIFQNIYSCNSYKLHLVFCSITITIHLSNTNINNLFSTQATALNILHTYTYLPISNHLLSNILHTI